MRHAFSLIELSIVLVILGLLVGGILAGQSLIRASELRGISAEQERFKTAVMAFRDKYFALPGDIANAQSFWGIESVCYVGPGLYSTGDDVPGTCNGDANGRVGVNAGLATNTENFRFWEHLAYAGLVEGTFSGRINKTSGGNPVSTANKNVPGSKFANGAWCFLYRSSSFGTNYFQQSRSSHHLMFGRSATTTYTGVLPCEIAIISPIDAWNVDIKIDDGSPIRGEVQAVFRSNCANSTAADDLNATYKTDVDTTQCGLLIKAVD